MLATKKATVATSYFVHVFCMYIVTIMSYYLDMTNYKQVNGLKSHMKKYDQSIMACLNILFDFSMPVTSAVNQLHPIYLQYPPCLLSLTSVKDIRLHASDNSSEATEWSREVMRTQYEWLFLNMTVTTYNASDILGQDFIIYTVCEAAHTLKHFI